MAFGPMMKLTTDTGLELEMAPFTRDEVILFADGFSRLSITQFLSHTTAQTEETEQAWYDGMIKDSSRLVWGIWVVGKERKLIGNFALTDIDRHVLAQATNGIMIFDKSFWGKGIASAVHRASLRYAFKELGLVRVKSAVLHGNGASLHAMEKSGFTIVYTERNTYFRGGKLRHQDNLECLNPDDWAWRLWWGDDRPTRKSVEARAKTLVALEWAEKNVELL
jgi:RimJ/RimL family protein N-acetyltransferase